MLLINLIRLKTHLACYSLALAVTIVLAKYPFLKSEYDYIFGRLKPPGAKNCLDILKRVANQNDGCVYLHRS